MYLTNSIVWQCVLSSVLMSVLHGSSAVRYSRSMRYSAPSIGKYFHYPSKYVRFASLPRSMQRRFMWREMDDTVDELMGGVASGARTMTQMFTPQMIRYRKPIDYDTQPSAKVKYILKKPPPPPPFKRMKFLKFRAPKKTFPIYNGPLVDIPSAGSTPPIPKSNLILPYMSEEELRKIEKEQEKRVESEHDGGVHEHSHQTHMDADVISGRINEFGEGWMPIQTHYSTPKPFAVSQLHTKVEVTTIAPPHPPLPPSAEALVRAEPKVNHDYEVTEHTAEESIQKEHAFKPSNHFDFLGPTTEVPNYPDYFLKNIHKSEERFEAKRAPRPLTTTNAPTTTSSSTSISSTSISSTTLTHRLPSRSTTERPFKRYNLHRPKSSKLFFNRATSTPESTRVIQTTTTTTEKSIKVIPELLPLFQEPIKTIRETIKTTRESLRTTKEPPKTAPPEKVRTTRNDPGVKSKIRTKNSSQNDSLPKVFNKNRGMVKFGEKQS